MITDGLINIETKQNILLQQRVCCMSVRIVLKIEYSSETIQLKIPKADIKIMSSYIL